MKYDDSVPSTENPYRQFVFQYRKNLSDFNFFLLIRTVLLTDAYVHFWIKAIYTFIYDNSLSSTRERYHALSFSRLSPQRDRSVAGPVLSTVRFEYLV